MIPEALDAPIPDSSGRPPPPPAGPSNAAILMVEDDPLIAMSTADMIEDLGHRVVQANSGAEALEFLAEGAEIDLVITDQAMPGMTGVALAAHLKETRPSVPVLLATGYADLGDGDGFGLPRLAKPYSQAQLAEAIDRLLAGKASAP